MNIVYLAAAVVDVLLFMPLYRAVKLQSQFWRGQMGEIQIFRGGLATVLLAFAIFFWAMMALTTVDSWITSLDPSRPKPYFLVTWFLGLFAYGITWIPLSPLQGRLDAESTAGG